MAGSSERLQAQLQEEHARCVELETELEVERTAHNSTAETLVEVQQRLEVTLQVRASIANANPADHESGGAC